MPYKLKNVLMSGTVSRFIFRRRFRLTTYYSSYYKPKALRKLFITRARCTLSDTRASKRQAQFSAPVSAHTGRNSQEILSLF